MNLALLGAISSGSGGSNGLIKAFTSENFTGNSTSYSVTFPSGTGVGDLVLVALATNAIPSISVGTNWKWLGNLDVSSSSFLFGQNRISIYWKVLDGVGDALTISKDANRQHNAYVFTFRNCNIVVPSTGRISEQPLQRGSEIPFAKLTGDRVQLEFASSVWSSSDAKLVLSYPAGFTGVGELSATTTGPNLAVAYEEITGAPISPLWEWDTSNTSDEFISRGVLVGTADTTVTTPYIFDTFQRQRKNLTSINIFNPFQAQVGDLVLIIANTFGKVPSILGGTGWTQMTRPTVQSYVDSFVGWKVLDGTGDNLSISLSGTSTVSYIAYAFKNADTVETASTSSGSGTSVDPPSLTTSTIVGDKVWLAAGMCRSIRSFNTTTQASYVNCGRSYDNLVVSYKENDQASEDPGAFTTTFSSQSNAWTIAVGNS